MEEHNVERILFWITKEHNQKKTLEPKI